MTTFAATVDRITEEARELRPARVLRTLLVLPFFLIGWLVGLVWLVVTLVWQGAWVGFHEARKVTARSSSSSAEAARKVD